MANLPEKNITTVDKVTSIPSNANLYINANGEFRQATVDDVLKASPVIADSIANQYKNAEGSPILLTDSSKGVAIEFDVKGRSTQDGEPTHDNPITPKSVGDMGWFDGELLQGYYKSDTGAYATSNNYVCNKNFMPCKPSDVIKLEYKGVTDYIFVLFYNINGAYIGCNPYENVATVSVVAPTNAYSFNFDIHNSTSITPQTAKHICVTINDKYALIVDSKGKNEILITKEAGTYGGIYDIDEDGKVKVSGAITARAFFPIGTARLISGKRYRLTGTPNGISIPLYLHIQGAVIDKGNGVSFTPSTTKDYTIGIYVSSDEAVTATNILFEPMLRFEEITDATYEPYIHSRKYIPISAPLRGIGEVTDVASLSECEVERKFSKVTYDGNSNIGIGSSLKYFYSPEISNAKPLSIKLISTHYKNNGGINVNYGNIYIDEHSRIVFADNRFSTASEVKEWLAENPITVIYELAEPTTESIEPIEIVTYDNVTHISVNDNADMEVEYPTSKVAGIASIGWSKGRRAEYDLEQLKAQMLALQTTIVSTV